MPVSKDASCYNMNHKNRGKCIIFNHETFDLSFDKREGSTLDAERLQKTFGKLGFDVETHNNLTHSEIMDQIDRGKNDIYFVATYIRIFLGAKL